MRCFPYKNLQRTTDLQTKKLRRTDLGQEFFQILAPSESAVDSISPENKLLLCIRGDSACLWSASPFQTILTLTLTLKHSLTWLRTLVGGYLPWLRGSKKKHKMSNNRKITFDSFLKPGGSLKYLELVVL